MIVLQYVRMNWHCLSSFLAFRASNFFVFLLLDDLCRLRSSAPNFGVGTSWESFHRLNSAFQRCYRAKKKLTDSVLRRPRRTSCQKAKTQTTILIGATVRDVRCNIDMFIKCACDIKRNKNILTCGILYQISSTINVQS